MNEIIDAIGRLAPLVAAFTALLVAVRANQAAHETKDAILETQAAIVETKDGVFEVGKRVDGRLSELLETTRALARAEGVAQGEQSQRDRAAQPEQK